MTLHFIGFVIQSTKISKESLDLLTEPLSTLSGLRRNPLFSHKIALDSCVGAILGAIGPGELFEKLGVKITGDPAQDGEIEFKWIFPILETKLDRNVSVGVFFRTLASMADGMHKKAQQPRVTRLFRQCPWSKVFNLFLTKTF